VAPQPDRLDVVLALGIGLIALVIDTLALAPDILYSDSGEFQALVYTGISPIHWLPGSSATGAHRRPGLGEHDGVAYPFCLCRRRRDHVGGVYLIVRYIIRQRDSVVVIHVLAQSIIDEVYTPATAFIGLVLLALLRWQRQPGRRHWLLFLAGFLLGIGLGVHLFLLLVALRPAGMVSGAVRPSVVAVIVTAGMSACAVVALASVNASSRVPASW